MGETMDIRDDEMGNLRQSHLISINMYEFHFISSHLIQKKEDKISYALFLFLPHLKINNNNNKYEFNLDEYNATHSFKFVGGFVA